MIDADAVATGGAWRVDLDGRAVLVVRLGDEFVAVSNQCGSSPLPLNFSRLDGATLRCSWHGCQYDVRTGARLDAAGDRLTVYPGHGGERQRTNRHRGGSTEPGRRDAACSSPASATSCAATTGSAWRWCVACRTAARRHGTVCLEVGTGGVALAQEFLTPCDRLVIVDAMTRGGKPGDVSVLRVDDVGAARSVDMHMAVPARVLELARALGALPREVFMVGCEPAVVDDLTMALSAAVEDAVEPALRDVRALLARSDDE